MASCSETEKHNTMATRVLKLAKFWTLLQETIIDILYTMLLILRLRPAVTDFLVLQGSHSPGSELYGSVGYSTGYAHMNFGGAQQSWRGSQPQL